MSVISMRRLLVTTAVFSGLFFAGNAYAAAAAQTLKPQGDWSVLQIAPKSGDGDSFCAMARRFGSDLIVTFARNPADEGSIAIDFQKQPLDKTKNYHVVLRPASGKERSFDTPPASDKTLIVRLGQDKAFFDQMQKGGNLNLAVNDQKYTLSIPDFAQGQADLDGCMASLTGKPSSSRQASAGSSPDSSIDDLREENIRLRNALETERRNFENQMQRGDSGPAAEMAEKVELLQSENDKLRSQLSSAGGKASSAADSAELKSLKAENEALRNDMDRLKAQVASATPSASAQADLAAAKQQAQDAQSKLADAQKQLAEANRKLSAAAGQQASTQGQAQQAQAAIDAANAKAADATARLADANRRADDAERRLADAQKSATDGSASLQKDLADARRAVDQERQRADAASRDLAAANQKIAELTQSSLAGTKAMTDANLKSADAAKMAADAQKQLADAQKQLSDANLKVQDLQQKLAAASAKPAAAPAADIAAATGPLQARLTALETENSSLRSDLAKAQAAASAPARMAAGADEGTLARISKLEIDLKTVQGERDQLSREIETYRSGKEDELMKISSSDWNLEQATRRFNEAEREIRRLGMQLEQERSQCTDEKKKLETMLFDPQIATQEQIAKLSDLEHQIEDYKQQVASLSGGTGGSYQAGSTPRLKNPAAVTASALPAPGGNSDVTVYSDMAPASGGPADDMDGPYSPSANSGKADSFKMDSSKTASAKTPAAPSPGAVALNGGALLSSDEMEGILTAAHLPVKGGVKKTQSGSGFVNFSWKSGDLFGSAEQRKMKAGNFDKMVSEYLQKTEKRCGGQFAAVPGAARDSGGIRMAGYEVACITEKENASVSVLFYGQGTTFLTISHEGSMDSMDTAMDARDSLVTALSQVNLASN